MEAILSKPVPAIWAAGGHLSRWVGFRAYKVSYQSGSATWSSSWFIRTIGPKIGRCLSETAICL